MNKTDSQNEAALRPLYTGRFHVPFYWSDPAGIMFFGNLQLAAHQVWEDWARSQPGLWELWFNSTKTIVYPIRTASSDFFAPMKYGQEFEASLLIESVSSSTFVLVTEFAAQGKVHARVRSVHTAVDVGLAKKTDLPQAWRAAFAAD